MYVKEFIQWLDQRPKCPLITHIRQYVNENKFSVTAHEIESLRNSMYQRLRRCEGRDFPNIEYHFQPARAERDNTPFEVQESRELAVVSNVIRNNGFTFDATTLALQESRSSHIVASKNQQRSLGKVVKTMSDEIAVRDVKIDNVTTIARLEHQMAEDLRKSLENERRNTAFLQQHWNGKQGGGENSGGNSLV